MSGWRDVVDMANYFQEFMSQRLGDVKVFCFAITCAVQGKISYLLSIHGVLYQVWKRRCILGCVCLCIESVPYLT